MTKLSFQLMDLGSRYLCTSRRGVVDNFRSPVITLPVGLYMNLETYTGAIRRLRFEIVSFANKGLDGINLGNILHHKSVKSKIPQYFKDQSVPIISYAYAIPIASTNFNDRQYPRRLL
jgi:hypothetical protein